MFTLHEAIRDYLAENDERDPYLIAPAIRHMIPKSQRLVVFDELIAGVVKDVERAMKNEAIRDAEQYVEEPQEVSAAATTTKARRTGRVANIYKQHKAKHEVYQELLDMIVGVNGRFRKPFGECTRRDVIALKEMHNAYADANRFKADKYERVEQLFDPDDDDSTVEELDDDDLIEAMK